MANPLRKLFRTPAFWLVLAFVIAITWFFATPARADQMLYLEGGSAMLRGETPTLGFNVKCALCGPADTDYEYGFELIGESSHYRSNPNVIQLHAQIVDGWKRVELGLGFYYLSNTQEYVCQFGFHLLARWRFSERIAAHWRHSSSAGSCTPNAGRDLLTLSWRFGKP